MLNIIETIDMHGRIRGKAIAHIHKDKKINYSSLVQESDALACYIIEKYGKNKTPIIVYGHKQNHMLICFLACVKSGHAYIPIDSSLPSERIADIIESSNSKLLLSVGKSDNIPNVDDVLNIGEIDGIIHEYLGSSPDLSFQVKDQDTYYIIYTSGSTGNPKGVQITLSCLMSFIKWGMNFCELDKDKRYVFMNQAPFSFDLSVMDLYLSLYSGSTLCSIDKNMIVNLKELFETFKQSGINVWVSTPSFVEMCLADSKFNEELIPELEMFLFCGETLTNNCVEKLHNRFKKAKVFNLYGPTEATVAISVIEIDKNINSMIKPLPVGRIKDDCKVIIIDKENKEVNAGEKGEIIIVGDSVSIGYYNNEEMTKKSFYTIETLEGIKRCYKTGDEGYIKDNLLYYCGRIDFQVKLNGYRIELEDIENNIRKIKYIKNCLVLPVIKEGKIQYLSAFVTLNKTFEEKDFKIAMMIKNDLKQMVPDYMVPRKIVIKESLPMTQNGKINRKLLMEELT